MPAQTVGKNPLAFQPRLGMLHDDALTGQDLVLSFLLGREVLLARFLMRDQDLFTHVIFLAASKSQIHPHAKAFKPRLGGGKFALEQAVVMRLADPARTEIAQVTRGSAQRHRFEGGALFFPE